MKKHKNNNISNTTVANNLDTNMYNNTNNVKTVLYFEGQTKEIIAEL